MHPNFVAASKATQKPRNGPNENAKNMRSPEVTPAASKDSRPVCDHPLPTLGRIHPPKRGAGGAVGLTEARVAIQGIGQIRSERGMSMLVFHQLALVSERDVFKKRIEVGNVRVDALELFGIEGIRAGYGRQELAKFVKLIGFDPGPHASVMDCAIRGLPCGRGSGMFPANSCMASYIGSKSLSQLPIRQSVTSPLRCGYFFRNSRKLNS